jgi:hypothetical protein
VEKIEIILTDCIQEIKAGKATLAECLDRYPEIRQELEPLIKLALEIREPGPLQLDSSYRQVARASLLRQIGTVRQKKTEPSGGVHGSGMQPQFNLARFAVTVAVAVIVVSMLAGGTVYAARSSLPGDLVYPVKTGTEDIRLLLAGSSPERAELNLKFAMVRLDEMSKLATESEAKTEIAVQRYKTELEAAGQQIRGITDTITRSQLLEQVLGNLENQTDFCDNVIDAAPVYTGPVREASTLSVNQRVQLLEMLEQDNILSAAQIDLDAMQNRLQRAQTGAVGRQYQSMQQALVQYRQFNQVAVQILESARSAGNQYAEIYNLVSQTLPGYLDTLDSISQQVPREYRNDIETSRRMTLQFQTEVHQGDRQDDGSGSGSEGTNSGNGEGPAAEQNGPGTPQDQGGNGSTGTGTPGPGQGDAPAPGPGGSGDGESPGNGTGPAQGPGENNADNDGNGKNG